MQLGYLRCTLRASERRGAREVGGQLLSRNAAQTIDDLKTFWGSADLSSVDLLRQKHPSWLLLRFQIGLDVLRVGVGSGHHVFKLVRYQHPIAVFVKLMQGLAFSISGRRRHRQHKLVRV